MLGLKTKELLVFDRHSFGGRAGGSAWTLSKALSSPFHCAWQDAEKELNWKSQVEANRGLKRRETCCYCKMPIPNRR
jgi:hypothetical protein